MRSTRGALPVFPLVGFPEPPPTPGGVIAVVGWIVVLAAPEATAMTLPGLLGILPVLQGIIAIVVAFKLPRTTAPASTTRLGATPDPGRRASG